jgi:hypothetical protein
LCKARGGKGRVKARLLMEHASPTARMASKT